MCYCPQCQFLFDEESSNCPNCKNKQFRMVEPNDPVMLANVNMMDFDRVTAVLQDNTIPFEGRVDHLESLPSVCFGRSANTRKNIFVAYRDLQKSKELLDGINFTMEKLKNQLSEVEKESTEAMSPVKRFIWRAISVVIFIFLIWAVVFMTDGVVEYVKNIFSK